MNLFEAKAAKGGKKMAPNAKPAGNMPKLPASGSGATKGVGAAPKGNVNKAAKNLQQKNTVGKKTNGTVKPSKSNSQKKMK